MDPIEPEVAVRASGSPRLAMTSIFLSPTRAFQEIAQGAHWVWPFLVCALLGIVSSVLLGGAQDAIWEKQVEEMQQRNPEITPEALQRMHGVTKAMQFVGAPLVVLAQMALSAGLFFLVFLIAGPHLGFKAVFRGLAYASLISYGAYVLLVGILGFMRLQGGQTIEGPADIVPAIGLDLLAPDSEGHARGILNSVNVFSLWWLVVLVYGFAALSARPRAKVAAPVLAAGLIWILATGWLAGLQFRPSAG